jgi:hypothetical protein
MDHRSDVLGLDEAHLLAAFIGQLLERRSARSSG